MRVPPPQARPVELFVEDFTGPRARNCGRHGVSATVRDLQRVVTCAVEASAKNIAFSSIKQDRGIEGPLASGLMGRGDGVIYQFGYDAAPCGGPGCPPYFGFCAMCLAIGAR